MDHPLKRCLGGDAVSFIEPKVDWLLRAVGRRFPHAAAGARIRLLDYGCGTGILMRVLRQRGYEGFLAGCDVSAEMLGEASRRWSEGAPPPLSVLEDGRAPFDDATFEVVVLCSVLHHVEPLCRFLVYEDAVRLLKPGGCVCVFEHNPFHPLAQWVVRHTPIDQNAVLLRPAEVRTNLEKVGATPSPTEYLLFSPPRWTLLRRLEPLLGRVPCGAQYAVCAERKPSAPDSP
jgi:SAM-dependent methyltransferase